MENILLSKDEIKNLLKEVLQEHEIEKQKKEMRNVLLSFNKVTKELRIGYEKLKKLIDADIIKTTPDGKHITQAELNKYMSSN
jgi:hypothetical protein